MASFPTTAFTRQITRHWQRSFAAGADEARTKLADPFRAKLAASSAQSMADDLLDQLRRSHAVYGTKLDDDAPDCRCPINGCGLRHEPMAAEREVPEDVLDQAIERYNRAKTLPDDERPGALLMARAAVLEAARYELAKGPLA